MFVFIVLRYANYLPIGHKAYVTLTDIKLLKYRILTSISLLVHMAAVLLRNTVNFTSLCACITVWAKINEPSAKRTNEYKCSLNITTFGFET